MGVVQQASGTWTGTTFTATLPGASSSANCVVLFVAGNTTVTTPASWTLRASQVNQMGHYLYDRAGFSLTSVAVTCAAGQGTWWIAEVASGAFDTGKVASANDATGSNTYVTTTITPTAGLKCVFASIGSTHASLTRTVSGWTNSFIEQADVCYVGADNPMQGVGALIDLDASGSTTYSTGVTYTQISVGRSFIIASYVTATASAVSLPELTMAPLRN